MGQLGFRSILAVLQEFSGRGEHALDCDSDDAVRLAGSFPGWIEQRSTWLAGEIKLVDSPVLPTYQRTELLDLLMAFFSRT